MQNIIFSNTITFIENGFTFDVAQNGRTVKIKGEFRTSTVLPNHDKAWAYTKKLRDDWYVDYAYYEWEYNSVVIENVPTIFVEIDETESELNSENIAHYEEILKVMEEQLKVYAAEYAAKSHDFMIYHESAITNMEYAEYL